MIREFGTVGDHKIDVKYDNEVFKYKYAGIRIHPSHRKSDVVITIITRSPE